MKKILLFASLLAIFLMLMIPNVSAIEYKTALESNSSVMLDNLQRYESKIKSILSEIENIFMEMRCAEISEHLRIAIENLLQSDEILQILVEGVIIPVLIHLIVMGVGSKTLQLNLIFTFIAALITSYFIMSAAEIIEQETGIDKYNSGICLVFTDALIAIILARFLIKPNKIIC